MMKSGLALRDFTIGDLELFSDLASDPEIQYYDGERVAGGWDHDEQSKLVWIIELGGDSVTQAVGVVACRLHNRNPLVYAVGIDLQSGWRGMGLGKLAMRRVLETLFRQHGADRVELLVRDYNQRAIRCYRAIGFREEGLRRKCGSVDGQIYGEMLMGILREEYLGPQEAVSDAN
jgi:RimJ/RimL family protein N-acetyltransferase